MKNLNLDSFIRDMPLRAHNKLAGFLDPGGLWERFAVKIPKNLTDINNLQAEGIVQHQEPTF